MSRTRYIAQAGMIAALYAGLTVFATQTLSVLAWGPVQFRISEALTVVGVLTPAAIPGLTLGSIIANLVNMGQTGPMGWLDVVFGSLGTFLGAVWMWRFRARRPVALAGPVIFNALIVPAYLPAMLTAAGVPLEAVYTIPVAGALVDAPWLTLYLVGVVAVAFGQAVVVYGLGWPLLAALSRLRLDGTAGERE